MYIYCPARPDKLVRPDRHGPPRPASAIENAQVALEPNTVHAFAHTVDRLRRQRSEQERTESQQFAHFLRQLKGRSQTGQTFSGNLDLATVLPRIRMQETDRDQRQILSRILQRTRPRSAMRQAATCLPEITAPSIDDVLK